LLPASIIQIWRIFSRQIAPTDLTEREILFGNFALGTAIREGVTPMLKKRAGAFLAEESGATAIEYGLIAAGIFLAIIPPVVTLSDNLETTYTQILSYFDNAN